MKSRTKSPCIPGFTINMIGFLSISPEINPMNLSSTGLIMQITNYFLDRFFVLQLNMNIMADYVI